MAGGAQDTLNNSHNQESLTFLSRSSSLVPPPAEKTQEASVDPCSQSPTFQTHFSSWSLTCFRERWAHSSRVSAASSFPWRLYRAPKFLRVVFTVGLRGVRTGKEVRMGSEKKQERDRAKTEGRSKGRREEVQEARLGWRAPEAKPASSWQLTCLLCRPCTSLRTQRRVCHPPVAGSAGGQRGRGSQR